MSARQERSERLALQLQAIMNSIAMAQQEDIPEQTRRMTLIHQAIEAYNRALRQAMIERQQQQRHLRVVSALAMLTGAAAARLQGIWEARRPITAGVLIAAPVAAAGMLTLGPWAQEAPPDRGMPVPGPTVAQTLPPQLPPSPRHTPSESAEPRPSASASPSLSPSPSPSVPSLSPSSTMPVLGPPEGRPGATPPGRQGPGRGAAPDTPPGRDGRDEPTPEQERSSGRGDGRGPDEDGREERCAVRTELPLINVRAGRALCL